MEYSKLCDNCGKKQTYSRKSQLKDAIRKKTVCNSCKQIGNKNHFFGKKHTEKTKKMISVWNKNRDVNINKKISNKLKGRIITSEQKEKISKKLKGRYSGEKNPNYGKKHSKEIIQKCRECALKQHYNFKKTDEYKKYYDSLPEYKKYKKLVWEITNKNDLTKLKNHEKRGSQRNDKNAYHLDHIFSISMGFFYKISPTLIGDIKNLKYINWRKNIKKGNKIILVPKHIKNEYEKAKKSLEYPQRRF